MWQYAMPEKEESKICIPKPEDGKTGIHSSNNGQRSTLKHNISKAGEAFNLKCTAMEKKVNWCQKQIIPDHMHEQSYMKIF